MSVPICFFFFSFVPLLSHWHLFINRDNPLSDPASMLLGIVILPWPTHHHVAFSNPKQPRPPRDCGCIRFHQDPIPPLLMLLYHPSPVTSPSTTRQPLLSPFSIHHRISPPHPYRCTMLPIPSLTAPPYLKWYLLAKECWGAMTHCSHRHWTPISLEDMLSSSVEPTYFES